MVIPRGKKLSLIRDNRSVTGGVPMILDEDITLSLSTSFKPLFGNVSNPIIDALGGLSADVIGLGFSSQFKEFGIQVWEKTDPLSVNVTITFNLGIKDWWDARREVYSPAIALASLPLPKEGLDAGDTLTNLQPPGPPSSSLLENEKYGGKYKPISMQIGRILYVPQVIVKKAEPTFSAETDENGNPIWAKVNLDIQSISTATVEMLKEREPSPEDR